VIISNNKYKCWYPGKNGTQINFIYYYQKVKEPEKQKMKKIHSYIKVQDSHKTA